MVGDSIYQDRESRIKSRLRGEGRNSVLGVGKRRCPVERWLCRSGPQKRSLAGLPFQGQHLNLEENQLSQGEHDGWALQKEDLELWKTPIIK